MNNLTLEGIYVMLEEIKENLNKPETNEISWELRQLLSELKVKLAFINAKLPDDPINLNHLNEFCDKLHSDILNTESTLSEEIKKVNYVGRVVYTKMIKELYPKIDSLTELVESLNKEEPPKKKWYQKILNFI